MMIFILKLEMLTLVILEVQQQIGRLVIEMKKWIYFTISLMITIHNGKTLKESNISAINMVNLISQKRRNHLKLTLYSLRLQIYNIIELQFQETEDLLLSFLKKILCFLEKKMILKN
jgi:hypothetical protein